MSLQTSLVRAASVLVIASLTSGCAKIWKTDYCEEEIKATQTAATDEGTTAATVDASARAALAIPDTAAETTEVPGVEIVWEVPRKPVEIYHLRYGFDREHLDTALTLPIDKLEKIDDPAHGPVFRFRLPGVPDDRDVYVSMQAENHMGISEPSAVVRISAQEKHTESEEVGGGS